MSVHDSTPQGPLVLDEPGWMAQFMAFRPPCRTDEDRMRLAIDLSRENVERGTGGPFGAAVFAVGAKAPVAVGVNSVVRLRNAMLHAEVLALMRAEQRVRSFTLNRHDLPRHELFTSCEPCAMCLGAALWSGVVRIVCGATRDDAESLGFDEGPVFPASYLYLEERGIEIVTGVLRDEAADVLREYRQGGGPVYNG